MMLNPKSGKQLMMFHKVSFFLVSLAVLSSLSTGTKPAGCQNRCGDLEILYPFGIGKNCSYNAYFDLYCDNSSSPPKLYLQQPYNFSAADYSQIYVKNWEKQWASACYGGMYDKMENNFTRVFFNFSNTPYSLSDANRVTAFGCDDLAILQQFSNQTRADSGDACLPYCSEREDRVGSCPGEGCCQISFSSETDFVNAYMVEMSWNWDQDSKFHNCSFAFVGMVEHDFHLGAATGTAAYKFNFNLSQLDHRNVFLKNSRSYFMDKPLVLDWRISSSNCTSTNSITTNTVCKDNSFCIPSDAPKGGYHCRCKPGYEGNPYLSPGCLDIDECSNNPCAKYGICKNTRSSYTCSCPSGYYGDGQKNGTGCTRVPPSHSKVAIGVGLGTGIGTLMFLSACFWLYKFHKKRKNRKLKEKFFKRNGRLLQQQVILEATQIFSAKELEKATDRFNTSRILGTGGQGTVYKGMLSDGKIIAIKRANSENEKHVQLFINEVVILSQINHRNVVRLLGCCLETQVPLLVYEFVSNRTLYDHIHEENNEFPLTWDLRLKIATEVAGALAYLHSATCHSIYHRDIKSRNILLDEKYVPKVSDFGTSLSIQDDQTHVTTQVIGTYGYIDPQYFQLSQFTEKSDVYSFGVVLVELLTTQRPTQSHVTGQEDIGLAARFLLCMEEGILGTILDNHVLEQATGKKEELLAVAKLAQRCLSLNGKERPTMKEVAITLESIRMSQTSSLPDTLAKTKFEGAHLKKAILTSDGDYTWTSTSSNTIPSSDACSSRIHTV